MAICNFCKGDMMKVDGCQLEPLFDKDGKQVDPIKFGDSDRDEGMERCPDCNVKKSHYHHPGCDWERCPICKGQMLMCGGDHKEATG